jgi:hypothetical protein
MSGDDDPSAERPQQPLDLSAEQLDNSQMLRELLGPAFSVRYEDFCRLSMGKFDLNTSLLMAAHALREFDSMLRTTLAEPMGAKPPDDPTLSDKLAKTRRKLLEIGWNEATVTDVLKGLKPKDSYRDQIKRLVAHLGLDADGDIATLWMSLRNNVDVAHKRSNDNLRADDEYRENIQRPFDTVLRSVLIALRPRYTSLMQHVDQIAAISDRAKAVKIFKSEISAAPPLQWRFFNQLQSGDWLPRLLEAGLLGGPPSLLLQEAEEPRRFGLWPAGSYLERMAASTDAATRAGVAKALRALPSELHPEILEQVIKIAGALPAPEIVSLVDLVTQWL